MVLDSQPLSVESIIHWADKLRGFSAGAAALGGAAEDWRVNLPTGKL